MKIFKIIFKMINWCVVIGFVIGIYFASATIKLEIPETFKRLYENNE